MGLPAGWVTGVPGLSRNDQLKAIGNGVMPAQCAAALRVLLERAPEALWSLRARAEAEMGRMSGDTAITEAEILACLGRQSAELARQIEEGAA